MTETDEQSWARRLLAEHPALVMSGLYFCASFIGLIYSWAFLRAFGVNAFRYAEISDLLLASLKEPFTWFLTAFAVVLVLADNAMSRRVQAKNPGRKYKWYGSQRYRQLNYIGTVVIVFVFLLTYATLQERKVRKGEGDIVSVHLNDGSPPKKMTLLGTTGKFVFLFDPVDERVDIHPNESIQMISKPAPDKRSK